MHHERIAIVDYGSQYTRLITRRLRELWILLLLAGGAAFASPVKAAWTELRSPHFTVYCEVGEKEARNALRGFEAIRSVFGRMFQKLRVDSIRPMVVVVLRDEASMKRFFPKDFEGKDPVRHAGYFQKGRDRDYAVIRLDVEHQADQPYFVVFHEYVHAIIHQNFQSLPVWLDEGIADFYGATELHGNQVYVGKVPLDQLGTLRRGGMLPLDSLLTATQDSPYYQEGTKAGHFYAESWALVHYLFMDEKAKKGGLFRAYLNALGHDIPPLEQAKEGLGSLKPLSEILFSYVQKPLFQYLSMDFPPDPEGARPVARTLDDADALVVRAELLMYTRQEPDSRPLLAQALALAPGRPEVHAAMGEGAFMRGETEAAWAAFEQALRLGSQDFRVPYHLAVLAQNGGLRGSITSEQILVWLESAKAICPDYPGTWMALCRQYALAPQDPKKAIDAGLKAVKLEPSELANWANLGSAYMALGLEPQAKEIGERLDHMASNLEERQIARGYAQQLVRYEQFKQERSTDLTATGDQGVPAGAESSKEPVHLKFSLPSNLAPLAQEVISLIQDGRVDEAIGKVEAARKKVRSDYERKSLKSLVANLQAMKAGQTAPAHPQSTDPSPK